MPNATSRKPFRLAFIMLLAVFAVLNGGCQPAINPADLPALPELNTTDSQQAIATQMRDAYDAVQRRPTEHQIVAQLGMVFRTYNNFEAAEIAFRRARLLAPSNSDWLYYHGETLQNLARYAEARDAISSVLKQQPNDLPASLRHANLTLQLGETDLAVAELTVLSKKYPNYSYVHSATATALERKGRLQDALGSWQRALQLDANFSQAHYSLAQLYRRLQQQEPANRHLILFNTNPTAKAARFDPRLGKVYDLNLSDRSVVIAAQRAQAAGDNPRAMTLLELAIERNPSNLETRAALIGAYSQARNFDQAQSHYNAGHAIDPQHAELNYSYGRMMLRQGRTDEAIQAFEKTIKQSPLHARALAWLGRTHFLRGHKTIAGNYFQQAVEVDPKNSVARRFAIEWFTQHSTAGQGIDELKKLAQTTMNDSPKIWLGLAMRYAQNNDKEKALEAINQGIYIAEILAQDKMLASLKQQRYKIQNSP